MRWRYKTFAEKKAEVSEWHRWFAWYPVRIEGTAVWLERVWRRGRVVHHEFLDIDEIVYEYSLTLEDW